MNTRRTFFKQLASGLFVASGPMLYLPKLVQAKWKPPRYTQAKYWWFENVVSNEGYWATTDARLVPQIDKAQAEQNE